MAASLERIVYCSRSTSPHIEAVMNLVQILAVSQRSNRRDEITGALAVSRGWFLQVVEGGRLDLDRLLSRLRGDPRHDQIDILDRRAIAERRFGDWAMAAPTITPANADRIDEAVDACRLDVERAVDLLHGLVSDPARAAA